MKPPQELGRRQIPGQPVIEEHPADGMQRVGQANEDVLSDGPGLRSEGGGRSLSLGRPGGRYRKSKLTPLCLTRIVGSARRRGQPLWSESMFMICS
jgi:hypothetical protein